MLVTVQARQLQPQCCPPLRTAAQRATTITSTPLLLLLLLLLRRWVATMGNKGNIQRVEEAGNASSGEIR